MSRHVICSGFSKFYVGYRYCNRLGQRPWVGLIPFPLRKLFFGRPRGVPLRNKSESKDWLFCCGQGQTQMKCKINSIVCAHKCSYPRIGHKRVFAILLFRRRHVIFAQQYSQKSDKQPLMRQQMRARFIAGRSLRKEGGSNVDME